jgi:hypothetical protein
MSGGERPSRAELAALIDAAATTTRTTTPCSDGLRSVAGRSAPIARLPPPDCGCVVGADRELDAAAAMQLRGRALPAVQLPSVRQTADVAFA